MKTRMLALVLAMSLLLTACGGGGAKATTIHLKRSEGTVSVADDKGKDITPREDLGLYSGYGVDTQSESYAWIDLDEVKLTKMDQDSEIAITKEGKQLEIEVKSGSLFFNVTQPLAEDETMTIRTSSMAVGIRGTCGWVIQDTVALLEGTVEVSAGEQTATVNAGEMAFITNSGEIEVLPFTREDVPLFVLPEIEADEALTEAISESAPIYPLTVLTRHSLYDYRNGTNQIIDYFYDEAGYILREERNYYDREGSAQTSTATYTYESEGHRVVTYSDGTTDEGASKLGFCPPSVAGSLNGCFADPMVTGWYDRRSEIGPDGRLEISDTNDPYLAGGYAVYTMDANGYPINIETYAPDGTHTGTCTLEWAVIEGPANESAGN